MTESHPAMVTDDREARNTYMSRWMREKRMQMSPTVSERCRRRRPHAEHVATWHNRRTFCDGAPAPAWYVIAKARQSDKPSLVGPFTSEADAHAYVTFSEDFTPLTWVVQAQAVDGG